jgi:mono/diheme cytochrome c family protein
VREWRPDDHGQEQPRPGSSQTAPAAADTPVSAEEAQARATLALWNVTCATCHARDGRGGGPGLPPGAKVPDLSDAAFTSTLSDEQLAASIRDGKGMMPGFGPQLGQEGVVAMVAHVRRLSAAVAPAPAAPAPAK